MWHIEKRPVHIGRFQVPFLKYENMRALSPGDLLTIGEQEITVMEPEANRNFPTKIRVDNQEISLGKRGSRFPSEGDQFIQCRHVRIIE